MKTVFIVKYQIIDNESGDNILEPYSIKLSAEYMSNNYFPNSQVIEIEEEIVK